VAEAGSESENPVVEAPQFVDDFVAAWTKVMDLDRFDVV
jgi:catalase (peroxidase I)